MYVNKCSKCGSDFDTKNPKRVICPNCLYPDKVVSAPASTSSAAPPVMSTDPKRDSDSETKKNYVETGQMPYQDGHKPRQYNNYNQQDRERSYNDKPYHNDKPYNDKPYNDKPYNDKPYNDKPYNDKPYQDRNRNYNNDRQYNDRPYNRQGNYQQGGGGGGYAGQRSSGRPQGNYGNRPPQQGRPQGNYQQGNYQQGNYQQGRPQGNYQQGNYGNRPPQGGRPPQGRPGGGGYQQRRPQGQGRPGPGGPKKPVKLLVNKDQLAQIELLYKPMLPLPNPDVHEVIAKQVELEPRKVFFGINLVRLKMKLPKLPFPKRKLAVTADQLTAIESLYTPLLPLPPIGCHKIIAKQLKMDEWRVHVGIGIIRKQMNLPRWNTEREDAPEEFKNKTEKELEDAKTSEKTIIASE